MPDRVLAGLEAVVSVCLSAAGAFILAIGWAEYPSFAIFGLFPLVLGALNAWYLVKALRAAQ